jgi:WD40 repeat protein
MVLFSSRRAGLFDYFRTAMSKRSIRGKSSSTDRKRHDAAPQCEEGPLASSASSSLGQASSDPKIPLDLIADLILPFVADRVTWNRVCYASKEMYLAGKKTTPPWPNKAFFNSEHTSEHAAVSPVAFSPSGLQLAFVVNTGQFNIHIWDRWGNDILLVSHTGYVHCMEYSLDGEYLASGNQGSSIRLWHKDSFHTTSKTSRKRATRTPAQADTILLGSTSCMALSFSATDSNLLASEGTGGEFNLWNVKEQACIHSINPRCNMIRSIFCFGGAESASIAISHTGSIIRLWIAEGASKLACEIIGTGAHSGQMSPIPVFSACGSFLARCRYSRSDSGSTLTLCDLKTMTYTQSVVIPNFAAAHCLAVSPDSKQLVVADLTGRIRLVQVNDLSIQRDLVGGSSGNTVLSLAFDPAGRVLACGYLDGTMELRTL